MSMTTGGSRRQARHPPTAINRMVLALLRSPLHGLLDPGICELRYRGRRSGRIVSVPVIYARNGERYVVVVGDAPDKIWWRNFTEPRPVDVRRGGKLRAGTCRVVAPDDPSYEPAWQSYVQRQHVSREPGDRLILIDFADRPGSAADKTAAP